MATITIPARKGKAVHVPKGQAVQVINTHGSQVIDTWAFAADDLSEFISLEHCRPFWLRLVPKVGDPFLSNRRRHLAVMEADSSPGGHDTLIAACDPTRYRQLGVEGFHDSCQANLHGALADLGLKAAETPSAHQSFHEHSLGCLRQAFLGPTSLKARRCRDLPGPDRSGFRLFRLPAGPDSNQRGAKTANGSAFLRLLGHLTKGPA